jgi:eukaryotic-like serine/threonine-protein kinase
MQDAALLLAGRYELGPVLGEGGMAKVHRAIDQTLHRPVAVKILAPPYDRDPGYVERFRREAHAAARLNHPNIVTVFDCGEDAGMEFIVMELVEGETLGARLRRAGPMQPEEVVSVGAAVASALAEAHARGVVHRDVKPGNVMLTEDGQVKVLDFGIARASGAEAVTRTGLVMGSASYLSPEQAQGSSADERSDVYALGCVLFQMATGRAPFVADDPVAALYQHVNEPVPLPSVIRAIPPALEDVIMRCLAKAPGDRYPSAAAVEAALLEAPLLGPNATEPLSPVSADETVPIATPIAAPDVDAPAAASADAPVAPAGRTSSHRASSGRSKRWAIIAGVIAALVLLAAIFVWADPFGPSLRREIRQHRRAEARTQPQTSPSAPADAAAVTGDPDVDAAYADLLTAIAAAQASGGIDQKTADAFDRRAQTIVEAFAAGDAGRVAREVDAFRADLAERIAEDKIDAGGAGLAIAQALDPLVFAMSADLPSDGTSTGPTDGTTGGDAVDEEEHGPPAHSNAGGNGNGNGHNKDD